MKTCLISQLNYIVCFLPTPEAALVQLQRLIDGFVKKKLPVAADRLYLPPELGGLSIFKLETFLQAQHCSWVARAAKLPIVNWRFDLRAAAPNGNVLLIRPCDINHSIHPILHNFTGSYEKFYGEFSKVNGNYKEAYIFSNPAFTRGPDTDLLLDHNVFANSNNVCALKFSDCFIGNRVKSTIEFQEDGIQLPAATWLRLQSALLCAGNRLRKNDDTNNLCENVSTFIQKIQRGSKKFRTVLELSTKLSADPLNLRTVTNFSNLTNTLVPNLPALKKCLGLWNSVWLQNDMRNFLYLLRSNGLLLNNHLNAFDPTVSPNCSFCRIIDRNAAPRDGFLHLFYECPITNRLLQQWCGLFEPQLQINDPSFRNFYRYGISKADEYGSAPQILVADTFIVIHTMEI